VSYTHLGDETPRARKPHRCYLCGLMIEAGEVHVKRSGVSEDGFDTIRMHTACEAKTDEWREDDWECHDPAAFREYELAADGGEGLKP
jgi:hypothetical protein